MHRMLIFAPVVEVQKQEEEWWKHEPVDNPSIDFFTFYQKHEVINYIMSKLKYYEYMVVPIILKDEKCEAINVFFPDLNNRCWIIEEDINSHPAFLEFRQEEFVRINRDSINAKIFAYVFCLLFELYQQKNYYFIRWKMGIAKEVMQNSNERDDFDYYTELKDIIEELLETETEKEFRKGLNKIDSILKGTLKEVDKNVIDNIIKNKILSADVQYTFLETTKNYVLGNGSLAAGIIIDIVRKLNFSD